MFSGNSKVCHKGKILSLTTTGLATLEVTSLFAYKKVSVKYTDLNNVCQLKKSTP